MAEQFPARDLRPTDVLDIINQPRFIEAESYVNGLLGAYSDEDTIPDEAAKREQEAIETLNDTFFGLDWLERRARIILIEEEEDSPKPTGVSTIDGKFIGIIPDTHTLDVLVDRESAVYVQQLGYRALAFLLEEDGEQFTLRMSRQNLLEFTVEAPPPMSEAKTDLHALQQGCRTFSHALQTDFFLSLPLKEQQEYIGSLLGDINSSSNLMETDVIRYHVTVVFEGEEEPAVFTATCMSIVFPDYENRMSPYEKPDDFALGPDPWLEIVEADDAVAVVPITAVRGIQPLDRLGETQATGPETRLELTDILRTVFASTEVMELISRTEATLRYSDDEDEQYAAAEEFFEEMDAAFPDIFWDFTYQLSGAIYREQENGTLASTIELHPAAALTTFTAKKIDNRWRCVMAFEVPTGNYIKANDTMVPAVETVFIIPTTQSMFEIAAYPEPETDDETESEPLLDDFTVWLRKTAVATKELVQSRQFRTAPREEQIKLLKYELAGVEGMLEDMTDAAKNELLVCTASHYYMAEAGNVDYTCADIAKLPLLDNTKDHLVLTGDVVSVAIPELEEDTNHAYKAMRDFPLSKAEPMVILENTEYQVTYFIPAQNMLLLSPYAHKQ